MALRIPRILLLAALALVVASCGGGGGGGGKDIPKVFAITTLGLPQGIVGVPYDWQISTVSGSPPITFDWNTGYTPPAWLSLSATGQLTGTPTAAGTTSIEVKATDSATFPASVTRTLPLEIVAAPQITKTSLARAIKGQPYSDQLTHNAPAAMAASFAISSGTLPTGISMNSSGAFSGSTTTGGLFVLGVDLVISSAAVSSIELDLVVYESLPFTYIENSLEVNDSTNTAVQLLPGAVPPGQITSSTRHIQAMPLTLNSDQNIAKPDASDFFKFNTANIGTIKVDVFYRYFVGEVDAYLWYYSGFPNHTVTIVARAQNIQVDDERLQYHNAQLSNGVGAGFYYLEINAPFDVNTSFWNRNAYTFKLGFSDLTILTETLDCDSIAGTPINQQVVALNAGLAPVAPQWSLVSGTLPPGVSFTTDGRFVGVPSQLGIRDLTVQVRDGSLVVERKINVRFFDSVAGNFWQVKGERRLYNGTTDPLFETFGEAMVVAPHPLYPTEGAIYVLGGRTEYTLALDTVRVFHTDRAGIPPAKQFKFEDIGKPLPLARRYLGAAFVQHSYGGYIYVAGGEIGAATGPHAAGDFYFGVERLQVADSAGVALPHPLATNWESVANLPQTEGAFAIQGWAEFGLVAVDTAADANDRLYLIAGTYRIEDVAASGVFLQKFHNAVLMHACSTTAGGTGTWYRKLDANPYVPMRFPAVGMINGRIYLAGGNQGTPGQFGTGGPPSTAVQMYQPDPTATAPAMATAGAAQFPPLTLAVYFPMCATLNGALYTWCGWDAAPQGTSRLHRFVPNPATGIGGTMTRLQDTDWATGFGAGVAHDGKLWLISGFSHGAASQPVNLRYTP